MASFGKILLPVDFSERSVDAARQAEVLARHFHSDVTVLHVVDPDEPEFGTFEPGGVKTRELETLLGRDSAGASISRIVRDGNPAREILDFAGSNDVDLIVMASHGYGPFESFVMGSCSCRSPAGRKLPRLDYCPRTTGAAAHVPHRAVRGRSRFRQRERSRLGRAICRGVQGSAGCFARDTQPRIGRTAGLPG